MGDRTQQQTRYWLTEKGESAVAGPSTYNVSMYQDGEGWVGSFGIGLTAFIEDVLSDGEGFDARIWYEADDGQVVATDDPVRVIDVREGEVILAGHDAPIGLEDIRRFDA